MMKYDFSFDVNATTSQAYIAKRVEKDSTVLEFGTANGKLTEYLSNELNCVVYGVEYNKTDAEVAAVFAKQMIIGDIEKYAWLEEFKNIRFDYIIFADVLEHLYNPEEILKRAVELLKDNGSILLSLPNIAHNSIIMELIENSFTYHKTGLLDNTHIRFFTKKSIDQIVERLELNICYETAIHHEPLVTEFQKDYTFLPEAVADFLKNREFSNVYQFVMELKKIECSKEIIYNSKDKAELFVDIGNGFNENNKLIGEYVNGSKLIYDVSEYTSIKALRLDPANYPISIEIDYIKINGKLVDHYQTNFSYIDKQSMVFLHNDPQIIVSLNTNSNINILEISFKRITKIKNVNEKLLFLKEEEIQEQDLNLKEKQKQIQEQEVQLMNSQEYIGDLKNEIANIYTKGRKKNITFLKKRKWKKIIEESGLFDIKYYIFTYPDVRKLHVDPINHYIKFGAKELRNPSSEFNTQLYLKHNHDIHKSGINPLVHYILYRENEDYNINNNTVDDVYKEENLAKQEKEIIADAFDEEYYLTTYPDVADSDISAIDHYYYTGWREERNPNFDFDTAFYLLSNPDIAQAGINPFFHYISMGRIEGRMCKHPAGYRKTILNKLVSPLDMIKNVCDNVPKLTSIDKLKEVLKGLDKDKVVLSLSHDKYNENIGGIQLCISNEQKALDKEGYDYININPSRPLLVLANDMSWYGDIIINNELIGTFSSEDILTMFENGLTLKELFMIVHSLHGHSPKFLKDLHSTVNFSKNFYWIHDYFSICEGYNLLRNNLAYCGAPSIESQACQICVYGSENRKNHLEKIKNIFNSISFSIISPSQTALDIWLDASNLSYEKAYVQPHTNIERYREENLNELKENMPLKIAFLGHPATHKGWFVFLKLVEHFKNDKRYEFYHLGSTRAFDDNVIKFFKVKNSSNNMQDMKNIIQEQNIHIAFLWSICPETYNLITFEALSAGASVLTYKDSGNIASEVNKNKHGLVLDSEEQLFDMFSSGVIREKTTTILKSHLLKGSLFFSDITTKYICQKEMN